MSHAKWNEFKRKEKTLLEAMASNLRAMASEVESAQESKGLKSKARKNVEKSQT